MKKSILRTLLLIILLVLSIVLGKIIGSACASISFLSWLNMGTNFGFLPATIDLSIVKLTFGITMSINVAQAILLLLAIIVYSQIKIKE